jgi:lipopolysaccharide transport system ATP-binding protein
MTPIIEVEHLSKQYRIGSRQTSYATLRDSLTDAVSGPFRRLKRLANGNGRNPQSVIRNSQSNLIWALKDVSFEVMPGEVVGIIGRNGAGKSTLLKILSRITEPTAGEVDLYGRVGSLLEVGTGFHAELTGRENIYLNGAVLGMKKAEIDHKFDEIVAFAEIERFIDTPVKHYSSGMYMRLAFSVAAHLEQDILIVDEVLAVGDLAFQSKCLGKMQDVSQQGRTVLFVSHNMAAVKRLCSRAILLEAGSLSCDSNVHQVVETYSMGGESWSRTGIIPDDAPRLYSTGQAKFRSVQLSDLTQQQTVKLYLGQPFRVKLTFDVFTEIHEAAIEVGIVASDGTYVTCSSTLDESEPPLCLPEGRYEVAIELNVVLLPRQYSFVVILHHFDGLVIDWVDRALDFTVMNVAQDSSDTYRYWPTIRGYVRPRSRWHLSDRSRPLPPTSTSTTKGTKA